ncbi:Protein of unknown function DUF2157, membrane [Pelosinus sp. UFO1]|nr:Protein of unknown function DUF2157, membrane [Pelosinus sp. UFO1]
MEITRKEIKQAIEENIISQEQGDKLWKLWDERQINEPKFQLSHLAYYFGALLVISAMGWFMNNTWNQFGGMGIFSIAVLYAVCFTGIGKMLWEKKGLRVAAGLLIVMAVCMTPLAIFGLERALGWWPHSEPGNYRSFYHWIRGGWCFIEVGTIASACIALRFFSFPLLTAPLYIILYFLSMDITPLLFGVEHNWVITRWVSLFFGLTMIVISMLVDYRCQRKIYQGDYAFWGYLFGTLAFWSGLTFLDSNNEWSRIAYCLINLGLLVLGILLRRKVFLVFGTIGVNGYIGHLAYRVFNDSVWFPFILSFVGIGIIYLGVIYNKKQDKIQAFLRGRVPEKIRRFLPE